MADIKELIEKVLSGKKLSPGENAAKVYRDEPILLTAAQMKTYTPPKYREMRKIAKAGGAYFESDAGVFYKQGRFMEDYEDDFDYRGDFMHYFPTYQSMNDHQLRGYFSWRTKVRQGNIQKTALSFVFVYIYELLNQIGTASPEDGFFKLKSFWEAYREINAQINVYMRMWLSDYVVYYNLDPSLLDGLSDRSFDDKVLTIMRCHAGTAEEVFSAVNSLSSYDFEKSKLFKQYGDDVKEVVCGVLRSLSDYYGKNHKNSLCERFFGKFYRSPYVMFKSAIFHYRIKHQDFTYEINDIHKYHCKSGSWLSERFFCYHGKTPKIGAILKTTDFLMRENFGVKSTLKKGLTTKTQDSIIAKEIEKYDEVKREAARPKVEIDVSKLSGIRSAALKTRDKLIVAGESLPEAPAPKVSAPTPEIPAVPQQNSTPLTGDEYAFLHCLLYGGDLAAFIRAKKLMPSVLADSVNEKLFDTFGDTVLCDGAAGPEAIEDYTDQLKGIIAR